MVRLLILVILAAIAFSVAYFQFKSIPMARKMIVLGGAFIAAAIALFMQNDFPLYMSFLAIVAVALLTALLYMKQLEKAQLEKKRILEERIAIRQSLAASRVEQPQRETAEEDEEDLIVESFGMKSINPIRKEQQNGQ